jgi:hypothetical protein
MLKFFTYFVSATAMCVAKKLPSLQKAEIDKSDEGPKLKKKDYEIL